jgi:hypothetical protein
MALRIRRLAVVGLLVVTAIAGVAAVSAGASGIPALDIGMRQRTVRVSAPDGANVRFTLRRSDGSLKEQLLVVASDGAAIAEFHVKPRPGDLLTVRRGAATQTIELLRLSLTLLDRVSDTVRGRGSAGLLVRVTVHQCRFGEGFSQECAKVFRRRVPVREGTFRLDTTGDVNLRGFQFVDVLMRSAAGDRYHDGDAVPVMFADLHEPFVGLAGVRRCETRTALLREEPGNVVIAAAPMSAGEESCSGQLAARGNPVDIEAGNQLVVDFATDAKMTIPPLIQDVDTASDVVTAECFPNRPFLLSVFSGGGKDGGRFRGNAGADATIVVDTTDHPPDPPVDIEGDHGMRLECMSSRGDAIQVDFTTPP